MISRFNPFSSYGTSVPTPAPKKLSRTELTDAQLYKLELLQTTDGNIYISKPVIPEVVSEPDNYTNNDFYLVFAKGKIDTNMVTEFWNKTKGIVPDGKGAKGDDGKGATGAAAAAAKPDAEPNTAAIIKIQELLNKALQKVNELPHADGLSPEADYKNFIQANELIEANERDLIIEALYSTEHGKNAINQEQAINKLNNAIKESDKFNEVINIENTDAITEAAVKYVADADIIRTTGGNNYVYLSAPANKKYPKNVTFSKKNPRRRMNAKSVRKLQNILNT
jgi:hypothetical protein